MVRERGGSRDGSMPGSLIDLPGPTAGAAIGTRPVPVETVMRALTRLCCLCLLTASGVAGATTLYQWKDAQGVTHYSQSPPADGKYQ
ncbi:DUF4124 domain-containing protein, partial [Xanthomonas translucens]|uniref:DUF4124 domain-containing protein n=1 Tax=Xanthomonas campestris pv. translucens TaxID=343 RepID=UPI0031B57BC8